MKRDFDVIGHTAREAGQVAVICHSDEAGEQLIIHVEPTVATDVFPLGRQFKIDFWF